MSDRQLIDTHDRQPTCCEEVLDGAWERVLGRKAVIDSEDATPDLPCIAL